MYLPYSAIPAVNAPAVIPAGRLPPEYTVAAIVAAMSGKITIAFPPCPVKSPSSIPGLFTNSNF